MSKKTFEALGLSPQLLQRLAEIGYENPTPVQQEVIPIVLSGDTDLIAQAETGTGKTGAFGIPMLELLDENSFGVKALVLAPTRELAQQVARELISYKGDKQVRVLMLCGGQPMGPQIKELADKKSARIVVGTPGRIVDHLKKGRLDLETLQFLVMDEVDEMLTSGFKEELELILEKTNKEKRTWMFSATLPPFMLKLAETYLKKYERVNLVTKSDNKALIDQQYYHIDARDKFKLLCRVIDLVEDFYGMVFCNTKRETELVVEHLIESGYQAEFLNGDLSQAQRDAALLKFRRRQCRLLIVTDVASRGIDIKELTHVVNYSVPQNLETYTHRIGRTGRAGAKGTAITFVQSSEYGKFLGMLKRSSFKVEKCTIPSAEGVIQGKIKNLYKQFEDVMPEDRIYTHAESLLNQYDAREAIAKLLAVGFDRVLNQDNYPEIRAPKERSESDRFDRGSDRSRGRSGGQGRYDRPRSGGGGYSSGSYRGDRPFRSSGSSSSSSSGRSSSGNSSYSGRSGGSSYSGNSSSGNSSSSGTSGNFRKKKY